MVASTDPLLAFYHDGYVRTSRLPYNVTSQRKEERISNYEKNWNDAESNSADHPHYWMLDQLEDHLVERGLVKRGWVSAELRPGFKDRFTRSVQAMHHKFRRDPAFFGVFGADFTLDADLNLWLFEVNFSPEFSMPIVSGLRDSDLFRRIWTGAIGISEELMDRRRAHEDLSAQSLRRRMGWEPIIDEPRNWQFKLDAARQ
jgi:hypothetical protein